MYIALKNSDFFLYEDSVIHEFCWGVLIIINVFTHEKTYTKKLP